MGINYIRQWMRGILSDNRDMRHWHFLKSTCDIRIPRIAVYAECRQISQCIHDDKLLIYHHVHIDIGHIDIGHMPIYANGI